METHTSANSTDRYRRSIATRRSGTPTPYLDYIFHLLDAARLPVSHVPRPNVTTMAAMLADLRDKQSGAKHANAIVLGRTLNRVIVGILSWHGGQHAAASAGLVVHVQTTVYRFPELWRARRSFEAFTGETIPWADEFDQWRDWPDLDDEDAPYPQSFRSRVQAQ